MTKLGVGRLVRHSYNQEENLGTVLTVPDKDGWLLVRWSNNTTRKVPLENLLKLDLDYKPKG